MCCIYPDAKAGEVEVAWVVQRQAGVVGVFQSVLKLHLHCQTPTRAANHIRLLSVEETQWKLTETKKREEREHQNISVLYLVPEMSMCACSTRSVVHTSSSPQSLKNGIWTGMGGRSSMLNECGQQQGYIALIFVPLTDLLIVVGHPSSSTGPLSVLLILNHSEKLIGRM